MKKFKLMTGLLLASTLVLTGCNLLGGTSKKNPKKKSSSTSSITTSVNPSSSGSSSSSGGEETVTVTSITADNPKTSYIVGEEFVKPKVTAQYSDSSLKDVSEYAVFSGYDMSKDGSQEVKVSYEENNVTVETSYTISVAPITVASIAISNQKVKYNVGDEFEKPTVTATYNDKSTKDVSDKATFSGYDMSKSGVQTVTVAFEEDGVKVQKTYDIRVLGNDWTDDEKSTLNANLNNNLLPFTSAIWTITVKEAGGLRLTTPDTTQEEVLASFEAATGWEAAGVDSYGDPYYVKVIEGVGRVVVNIWVSSSSNAVTTIMDALFQEKQSKTEDTAWSEEYTALFNQFFEGETLPFYQFGADYEIYDYSLFNIEFYDYFDEDLTAPYGEVLVSNGYTSLGEEEGYKVYGKEFADGDMYIYLNYTIDTGNGVYVAFDPASETSESWPEIEELAQIEAYSGVSVPHFSASSYKYYVRLGYVFVETETTSNLAESYAQSLASLGLICELETDYDENIIGGSAVDWEEKISIQFQATGEYNDDYEYVVDGFTISVCATNPESTFVEDWPADYIAAYLETFEILENDIPVMVKPVSGKDFKVSYLSFEEAYEQLYEAYYFYIIMGVITEEEIAEWAQYNVGVYVGAYDPQGTGVDAYNALFDSTWTKEEETDEDTGEVLYTYWTKDRITVCVYGGNGIVYAQIMEPGETPVPPEEGSTLYTFTNKNSTTEMSGNPDTVYGWFNASGENVVTGVAAGGAKIFAGAAGGSGDYKWTLDNALKLASTSNAGSITLNLADGVSVTKITLTGYGWRNKDVTVTVGGVSAPKNYFTDTSYENITAGAANSYDFVFETPITGSVTISSDCSFVCVSMEIFYE